MGKIVVFSIYMSISLCFFVHEVFRSMNEGYRHDKFSYLSLNKIPEGISDLEKVLEISQNKLFVEESQKMLELISGKK